MNLKVSLLLIIATFTSMVIGQLPVRNVTIKRVIPHASRGFTQGLDFYKQRLFEGTGQKGKSAIFSIEPNSGKIIHSKALEQWFGEGITIWQDRAIQLTWKHQTAYIYKLPDFTVQDSMTYTGEGWGLTHDKRHFIMSNGSDTLYWRTPRFRITRKLAVKAAGQPLKKLNELEWIEGLIYANIWYDKRIAAINPFNGNVEFFINCQPLFSVENPRDPNWVLNGIAYRPETNTLWLTGKNWKNIFEVSLQ